VHVSETKCTLDYTCFDAHIDDTIRYDTIEEIND